MVSIKTACGYYEKHRENVKRAGNRTGTLIVTNPYVFVTRDRPPESCASSNGSYFFVLVFTLLKVYVREETTAHGVNGRGLRLLT